MSGIFSAGILPGGGAPATYRELVEFFEGDRDAADAWLVAWLAYAGDGATSEQLLAALEAAGTPSEAVAILEAGGPQTFRERIDALVDGDATCLAAFVPSQTSTPWIEDARGLVAASWSPPLTSINGEAGLFAGEGATNLDSSASAPLRLLGALTVHCVVTDRSATGAAGYAFAMAASGETEGTNYLYSLSFDSATDVRCFAEKGTGSNLSVTWGRGSWAVPTSRTSLYSLTRSASGRLRLYRDGVLLTVTAASGDGAAIGPGGAYADLDLPTGGSTTVLHLNGNETGPSTTTNSALIIYNVEQTDTKVLEIAQTLGFA